MSAGSRFVRWLALISMSTLLCLVVLAVFGEVKPVSSLQTVVWTVAAISGVLFYFLMVHHSLFSEDRPRSRIWALLVILGGLPAALIYYWMRGRA